MTESPWVFDGEVARTGSEGAPITLLEGTDFCLSDRNGDVSGHRPHGLFLLDSRFLSRFELRIDGKQLEGLGVSVDRPGAATFMGRIDATLVVIRQRAVGRGLTETIIVRNHELSARTVTVALGVDADFADLFEVKESRAERRGWYGQNVDDGAIHLGHQLGRRSRESVIACDATATLHGGGATWHATIEPGGAWTTTITVSAVVDGEPLPPVTTGHQDSWHAKVPQVETDDASLQRAVARAAEDLGSLRIFDPEFPDEPILAAGAPWFMSPFGRDSLLTAWMALIVDPDLALGVLKTLARLQGTATVSTTEEEPGRILHEIRFGDASSPRLGGGHVYYGSVDATPLFVMLLGELRRWGLATELVDELLPHAERALAWLVARADRDPDGYIRYYGTSETGLANQGWKDSWDGIRYGDGRVAQAPIALCEVQAYAYAAYLARAHSARASGDEDTCRHWHERAMALRTAFNRDFWLPERGYIAVGLDADRQPIDSLASNQGHCLWTGIVDIDKAASVADALLSAPMFSGWGVRTLAASEPAYNPVSYHCGSVWPHDNAIIAAGLMRYGFVDHAHRVMRGVLDVADANAGRLPELISGIGRDELRVPAAYPTSCVPQAWAAATPLLFLRLLLRFDPWVPNGQLWMSPALPEWLTELRIDGIPLRGRRLNVIVEPGSVRVDGLSEDITLYRQPREPLTSLRNPPER